MIRHQLIVEHHYKGRKMGAKKFKAGPKLVILGSSHKADLRLLGDLVSGVHAGIEFNGKSWRVSDLGSPMGTLLNGRLIVEEDVQGPATLKLADHELKLLPVELNRPLFEKEDIAGYLTHHQVVVMRSGEVLETHVLKRAERFSTKLGSQNIDLNPPTSGSWTVTNFGKVEVRQRLVEMPKAVPSEGFKFDSEMKWPLLVIAGLLVLLLPLSLILRSTPEEKPQNQMTQMIFDAKVMKQKRAKAERSQEKFTKAGTGAPATSPTNPKKTAAVSTKVINSIQASGLHKLLGKIAARTSLNANAISVQSTGVSKSGPSSTSTLGKADVMGAKGESYRVGAVGTAGRAGGGTGYAEGTGLAGAGVGAGEVGVIDEETVVEGGLDPEVIAQYIRSQLGQIRYCYERALSGNPDLYGKVTTKFTIGPDGRVTTQSVANSTLRNASVEGCILRRIASWKFPTPKGGTSVLVTYPFLFKSTN